MKSLALLLLVAMLFTVAKVDASAGESAGVYGMESEAGAVDAEISVGNATNMSAGISLANSAGAPKVRCHHRINHHSQ